MCLFLQHPVQSPGDPQDDQGKEQGDDIGCVKAQRCLPGDSQQQREESSTRLHQHQCGRPISQGPQRLPPDPLPAGAAQQGQRGQRQQIPYRINQVLTALRPGNQTGDQPAQQRVESCPRAPAHHHNGCDRRCDGDHVGFSRKPTSTGGNRYGLKGHQHQREKREIHRPVLAKCHATLHHDTSRPCWQTFAFFVLIIVFQAQIVHIKNKRAYVQNRLFQLPLPAKAAACAILGRKRFSL